MKILDKKISRAAIGTEWECIYTEWKIVFDLQDFNGDANMYNRFRTVIISSRKYKDTNSREHLYFKGCNTQTFSVETKDKQKRRVIQMINDFISNNDEPLISMWENVTL